MEDFITDFEFQEMRILCLRMDDRCYKLELSYVPFLEITDFVNDVNNLDTTIKFILFSTTEEEEVKNVLVTVFRGIGEKFKIQTLYIKLTRILTSEITDYEDIFPPKLEGKNSLIKNIKRLNIGVTSYGKF